MRRRADTDPFAVRIMTKAGEEIPFSDPYVTDAQRAAAGRETVAERARALLAANRERAAGRYADGGLPDGEDAQRVWRARDPADLRARLGRQRLTAWAEDDILHVLWQAGEDNGGDGTVTLSGGLSGLMWPVDGADGLYEASLRVRRLDEAVLSLFVVATGQQDLPFGRPVTDRLTWRGPRAPAVDESLEARPLAGQIREHTIESAALRAARPVTVYVPPAKVRAGPLPACVLADGQATRGFAEVLEAAILSGAAPPVLLVGIHNASSPGELTDRRSQEYLPRYKPRRFAAHLSFVTGEVIPWAAAEFDVDGPWTCAGFSNGAAWAAGTAVRRPDLFGGAAALSLNMAPARIPAAARGVRQFLAAGTLEPSFRRTTREYAQRLRRAGVPCAHQEWVGGHDSLWWRHTLPDALAWILS
jgi:enterochelin esterase-like enzyme